MKPASAFIHTLTDILVHDHVFTEQQAIDLEKAFVDSPIEEFDEFLLGLDIASKDQILEALGKHYQVPYFDVQGFFFDPFLVHKFPKGFLLRNGVIPIEVDNDIMGFAVANPKQKGLTAQIMKFVSHRVRFNVGIKRHICDAVKETYDEPETLEPRDDQ